MNPKQDPLKDRRTAFCRWYLALGNPAEAARRAGCDPDTAEQDGLAMLHTPYCRAYLKRLAKQPALPVRSLVMAGLARLAFGSANDAAKLAFAEEISDEALRSLDLFHVVSIRHDRNGAFEVKLADRQSAMERLLACAAESDSDKAAAALLAALQGEVNDCDADLPVFAKAADRDDMVADT